MCNRTSLFENKRAAQHVAHDAVPQDNNFCDHSDKYIAATLLAQAPLSVTKVIAVKHLASGRQVEQSSSLHWQKCLAIKLLAGC